MEEYSEWSDLSLFQLFQHDVSTEAQIINETLENFANSSGRRDSIEIMLLASSAIGGAAALLSNEPLEKLARALSRYFLGWKFDKLKPEPQHIPSLMRAIATIESLCNVNEADLPEWINKHTSELLHHTENILKLTPDFNIEEKTQQQKTTKEEGSSSIYLWQLFCQEIDNYTRVLEEGLIGAERHPYDIEHAQAAENTAKSLLEATFVSKESCLIGLAEAVKGSFSQKDLPFPLLFQAVDIFFRVSRIEYQELKAWKSAYLDDIEKLAALLQQGSKESFTLKAPSFEKENVTSLKDKTLFVSSKQIDKVISLSEEWSISAHWLNFFSTHLMQLKSRQMEIFKIYQAMEQQRHFSADLLREAHALNKEYQNKLSNCLTDIDAFAHRTSRLGEHLYNTALSCRMRPFSDEISGLCRIVRDQANDLNKSIELQIKNKETLVDHHLLEKLFPSITLLLENCIQHGIKETGSLYLEATRKGGVLIIALTADGWHIPFEEIKKKAFEMNLISYEIKESITPSNLISLILENNLYLNFHSLQKTLNSLAGHADLEASERGLKVELQIPLLLPVVQALVVKIAGEAYAFPLSAVDRVITATPNQLISVENHTFITLDSIRIPMVAASTILEVTEEHNEKESYSLVVISDGELRYAICVDQLLGEEEILLRELDHSHGHIKDIKATATLENGSIVLMLDVVDLIQSIQNRFTLQHQ